MNRKTAFITSILFVLCAIVGMATYNSYQEYKKNTINNLLLTNVEALTGDDTSAPSLNGLSCDDKMGACYGLVGVHFIVYSSRIHDKSTNKDVIQQYRITYCFARGNGNKKGSNDGYINEIYNAPYHENCESGKHIAYEKAFADAMCSIENRRSNL